jgi:thioredoxin-related protein
MKRLISRIIVAVALVCVSICAAPVQAQTAKPVTAKTATPSAEVVLANTLKQSEGQKKSAMVIFHASWCGWCHKLDDALKSKTLKPIMDKYFITTHLTVLESKEKKADENVGADTLMKKWGGEQSGLPFYTFLDAKGKKIADSNAMPKNQNIGYPGAPEEIEAFMGILKRAAPAMTTEDAVIISEYLTQNAPKASSPAH